MPPLLRFMLILLRAPRYVTLFRLPCCLPATLPPCQLRERRFFDDAYWRIRTCRFFFRHARCCRAPALFMLRYAACARHNTTITLSTTISTHTPTITPLRYCCRCCQILPSAAAMLMRRHAATCYVMIITLRVTRCYSGAEMDI